MYKLFYRNDKSDEDHVEAAIEGRGPGARVKIGEWSVGHMEEIALRRSDLCAIWAAVLDWEGRQNSPAQCPEGKTFLGVNLFCRSCDVVWHAEKKAP